MNLAGRLALFAMVLFGAVTGCDSRPAHTKIVANAPSLPSWQRALSGEVHAMADGSAYIIGAAAIFYISQGKMTEVRGLGPGVSITATLTPLADGTALLMDGYADPPKGFWLKRDSAESISNSESAKLGTTTTSAAGYYFVQAARLQQEVANRELISPDECADYYDDVRDSDERTNYE
jgi:hypothetical protein